MVNSYDIAWRAVLAVLAPICGFSPKLRRKVGKALRERAGRDVPLASAGGGPCLMIHAVSLGEMNATRAMVARLADARPDLRFLITTTTDTGFARAGELYGRDPRVAIARFPLDLSLWVVRMLDRQRPTVVVLMELEVWPNFVRECERRGIPVILVNGRLTGSSFRNYRLGGPLVRRMFRRLSAVCAQDEAYADRFRRLGARPEVVRVTGTMKFDTARVEDGGVPGTDALAEATGLQPGREPIWVCGSTGTGEEAIVLRAYKALRVARPTLRLAIVPRHPERFDAVASLVSSAGHPVFRRSVNAVTGSATDRPPVILGDTMGELRKFYALADVVTVCRSLVDLGPRQRGSDMIEPAALGKPTIVGPWTQNFEDVVRRLKAADAIVELPSADDLPAAVAAALDDPAKSAAMGERAKAVVRAEQGATDRHVEVVLGYLSRAK